MTPIFGSLHFPFLSACSCVRSNCLSDLRGVVQDGVIHCQPTRYQSFVDPIHLCGCKNFLYDLPATSVLANSVLSHNKCRAISPVVRTLGTAVAGLRCHDLCIPFFPHGTAFDQREPRYQLRVHLVTKKVPGQSPCACFINVVTPCKRSERKRPFCTHGLCD